MKPSISILIITYNRAADLLDLLKSISEQISIPDYLGEVLILNNASTESYQPVKDFIANHHEIPFVFIDHPINSGVAAGRNILIKKASFPVLMVLDDDVVFKDRDALAIAARIFDTPFYRDHHTAVITMNIFYYQNGERQLTAFPHKSFKRYKDASRFLTYYFTGAAHLMRKDLFEKTGLYPEDFFYGMEEYDLSYRIIDSEYTLAFDDQIHILHKESPAGRIPARKKLRMMWYNKSVVAWRYLPLRYYFSTLIMWAFEYLRKSKWDVMGVMMGFVQGMKVPSRIKKQRIGSSALSYLKSVHARLWY